MPSIGVILERNARRVPDRLALVCDERRYSYREFDNVVNQAARVLSDFGVRHGDCVAIMGANSDTLVIAYYGLLKLGAITVPTNMRLAPPELAYQLEDAAVRLILHDPELTPVVTAAIDLVETQAAADGKSPPVVKALAFEERENAAAETSGMAGAMTGGMAGAMTGGMASAMTGGTTDAMTSGMAGAGTDGDPAAIAGVHSLRTRMARESTESLGVDVGEDDDAQILYTSGTTGRPKGVLLDHHRIVWTGINAAMGVGLREGDVLLHVAPLYHSAELNLFLMAGTYLAATHIVVRTFDPALVLQAMSEHRVTAFFGVPTMYQFMLRNENLLRTDLSAWRIGMFGAAPMAPSLVTKLAETLPELELYNLCGLTEMGPGGVFVGGDELRDHPSAAGRPTLNTEARVVNDDFADVAPGEVGELLLRGETLMKGYWNKPEATADAIRDGWLFTGDLATVDDTGLVYLVDRKKDMILTGGMNVYSVEVENAVITHPAVADCAVVGVPHPDYGETVTAIVSVAPGATLTTEELREHCKALIADYKVPRILVVAPIPRNASGKILKYQIRQQLTEAAAN
ncbi:long-chain-fatty-acid--CoA ligase [Alicyclobacillus sp. ALC3]|uniref:long-chain-fatty-acid--CoA ligase n=1 Tax=Alicyclobacillus sp. ALC3 TaxID=2796143 RepID=UPI0023791B74|nr:long-chain-fatty-acid--CoA ligase [Alicyclobacillus sp. ALC3]WDL95396.1 long-chain-fatty-acid--CoA ligase [Alicyclobacillus sp. ALC3]